MRTLISAKEAVMEARKAVLEAVEVHDWLFGLDDADRSLEDAISALNSEISKHRDGVPSDPIALQVTS